MEGGKMKITYLGHSGFFVEMEETCFLFDYYKGEIPKTDEEKKWVVCSSHAHYDHYNNRIFDLARDRKKITFLLSGDIKAKEEEDFWAELEERKTAVKFLSPYEETEVFGCHVRTLRSNDEGVAFLVQCEGHVIYHGGDLNWWHWEGESDKFNALMQRSYETEMKKLEGQTVDVAFVAADPRLGRSYTWGLDCFMRHTCTRYVFPMHFWGEYTMFDRLFEEQCTSRYKESIIRIEKEGQTFFLDSRSAERGG